MKPNMRLAFHCVAKPARAAEYFPRLADSDAKAISSIALRKCRKISSALRPECAAAHLLPLPRGRRIERAEPRVPVVREVHG